MRWEADEERILGHASGSVLVTGPPGSGKTTLLRERFARLIEGGADPERVVLFTLNRRAAREARDVLAARLARSLPDLPVFTVHGFAFRVLGHVFDKLGYDAPPQVLSAPEQYAFVRQLLLEETGAEWPRLRGLLQTHAFARQVADFVLRAQERLLDPEALASRAAGPEDAEVAAFYQRYLDALLGLGQVDFAGLLFQTVSALDGSDERFEHVLVDDYHDATHAAEEIVRALGARAESVVVAADPAGHVFSYRGGSLEPLRRIDEMLGSVERVELPRSHRLGDVASLVALDDAGADPAAAPPPWLSARLFAHPGEEAEAVAHELLRRRVEEDVPWDRMAVVLRRYGAYLTGIRHALARHGIPFVVVAEAADVAAEPVNRPVLDLLRYAFRPDPPVELLEAVLTSPVGGLDPHELRQLRREARMRGVGVHDLVLEDPLEGLPGAERLAAFRGLLTDLREVAGRQGPDGVFFWLWTRLPHFRSLADDEERPRDLDAVAALGEVLSRFAERRPGASIEDYLDTLEAAEFGPDPWIPPEERRPGAVRVISAHRAQGLEFEVALVAGCLEGEFPALSHRMPIVDLEAIVDAKPPVERFRERLAEERALFRLAVTRARRATVLFASTSTGARSPRSPSRFAGRLGVTWSAPEPVAPASISLRTMEASLRRTIADPAAPAAERLAAVAALPAVGAEPVTWWRHRDWTDPGLPVRDGEFKTSYSRLESMDNCGLQYLYAVELGLDPDATHYMWLGSVIHDIVDKVQQGELERSREAVFAALEEVWDPRQFPNRAVEHRRLIDARAMLDRWIDNEHASPAHSEVAFAFPIGGALLRGRIDAIFRMENGGIRVLDYKTSRSPRPQHDAHEDLQLATYYLGVKRDPDLAGLGEPKHLQLGYLGAAHYRSGFVRRDVYPRQHDGYEENAVARIEELIRRVREEDFAPDPDADCRFCRFKPICPLWPQGREVPA